MPLGIAPICLSCRYFLGVEAGTGFVCAAFMSGIPIDILSSRADHRDAYEGDGGLRYRPKAEQDEAEYCAVSTDDEQCRGCQKFVLPNGCKIVAGQISRLGWCPDFIATLGVRADAEFVESEHPRDEGGKFTEGGGGSTVESPRIGYERGGYTEEMRGKKKVFKYVGEGEFVHRDLFKSRTKPTKAEKKALDSLDLFGLADINDELRKGRVPGGTEFVDLSDYLDRSSLPKMILYRGIDAAILRGKKVGDTFLDLGFASTSTSKDYSAGIADEQGGYLVTIKVPEGSKGAAPAAVDFEYEVVLQRGTTFQIESIDKSSKTVTVSITDQQLSNTRADAEWEENKHSRGPCLFVDLDGVLADFDAGYAALSRGAREVDWSLIKAAPGFWRDLPLMPDAMVLWEAVRDQHPTILTGLPDDMQSAEEEKRAWVEEHLGPDIEVICCRSEDKASYARPGDILVDDREKYRALWEGAGGVWITHRSAEESIRALGSAEGRADAFAIGPALLRLKERRTGLADAVEIQAAGIMHVTPDGRVLLLRRTDEGDQAGTWAFPGGKLEEGEDAEAAAIRETEEETGRRPDGVLHPWMRSSRDGVDFSTFITFVPEPFEPVLNDEHDQAEWVEVPGMDRIAKQYKINS